MAIRSSPQRREGSALCAPSNVFVMGITKDTTHGAGGDEVQKPIRNRAGDVMTVTPR
jgi:hypothetical protein